MHADCPQNDRYLRRRNAHNTVDIIIFVLKLYSCGKIQNRAHIVENTTLKYCKRI